MSPARTGLFSPLPGTPLAQPPPPPGCLPLLGAASSPDGPPTALGSCARGRPVRPPPTLSRTTLGTPRGLWKRWRGISELGWLTEGRPATHGAGEGSVRWGTEFLPPPALQTWGAAWEHSLQPAPSCRLRRDPWPPAKPLPIPGPQTLPVLAAAVSPRFFWKLVVQRETPEHSPCSSGPFPSLQARVKLTLLPLPEGPALALWAWISRSPGPARETVRGSPVSLGPPFPPLYSGGDLAHRGAPGDVCTRSWLSRCVGGW